MIGSGENAIFINVKKGTKVMLFDGTIIESGLTKEEQSKRLEKRLDNIIKEPINVKKKVLSLFNINNNT